MLRRSNMPLWNRFTRVMSRRLILGLHTYFVKCSSHGKVGKSQHPSSINLWNDRADAWAGNFATKGPFIHDWWPEGELDYHVLHRGKAIRGDVRAHIRSQFEEKHFSSALPLKTGGFSARLARGTPEVSKDNIKFCRSADHLAKTGKLHLHSFAFAFQNLALRTPDRCYTSERTMISSFYPRGPMGPICPLYQCTSPSTWHYATACPVGAPVRKLTQRACGSLVMGLAALTGEFVPPLEHLAEWFAVVTNSDTYNNTYKAHTMLQMSFCGYMLGLLDPLTHPAWIGH
jgi:hypothetical protein